LSSLERDLDVEDLPIAPAASYVQVPNSVGYSSIEPGISQVPICINQVASSQDSGSKARGLQELQNLASLKMKALKECRVQRLTKH
jgi:hypothetical protein